MREKLARLYDPADLTSRTFSAQFVKFGRTDEDSNTALLVQVWLNGFCVADHVWIHRSKKMKKMELLRGDVVEFEAVVCRYARNEPLGNISEICYDYGLDHVRDMRVIQRRNIDYQEGAEIE
jgi:hypothetical protein